jgi:DNA-binding transcriptional LysR family regulator
LNTQLFIRRPAKRLQLTAAGRELLPQARSLLVHAEEVRDVAASSGSVLRGHLSIGCYRTAAPFILPALIKSFALLYPDVEVSFVEAPEPEIEEALLEGRCEIAIVCTSRVGPGITLERVYATAPYVLLAADHRYAVVEAIDLRLLGDEPFISLQVPPSDSYELEVFEAFGIDPPIRYRSSGYELCRSLVAEGLGWGLLISRPHGDRSYAGLPVVAVPISGDTPHMDVGLAWAQNARLSRRAVAFADHCKALMPNQVGAQLSRPVARYASAAVE